MLSWIIGFIRGSVTVEITGADVERYLSACAARGVDFSDITRVSAEQVRATTGIEDYFSMRRMARRAMCGLKVCGKRGAPFAAHRFEKRWGLLLGLAMCALAVWYLTGFVWTIEIEGCQSVSQLEILRLLEQNGLKTGARLSQISPMQIKNGVLSEINELSFLAVNLMGTHAQVVVRERKEAPETAPMDAPCDVYADKAGVILRLRVKRGAARVAVGQTILPGDIIASGTMVSALGDTWLVHAEAEADLRVWHNERRLLPDTVLSPAETGASTVRRAIIFGDRRINLYMIESEPYAWYYKEVKKTPLVLSASFRFPIMLVTEIYTELTAEPAPVGAKYAAGILESRMREQLELQIGGAEIVSFRFEMEQKGGAFLGRVQAECIETTGIEKLIK